MRPIVAGDSEGKLPLLTMPPCAGSHRTCEKGVRRTTQKSSSQKRSLDSRETAIRALLLVLTREYNISSTYDFQGNLYTTRWHAVLEYLRQARKNKLFNWVTHRKQTFLPRITSALFSRHVKPYL